MSLLVSDFLPSFTIEVVSSGGVFSSFLAFHPLALKLRVPYIYLIALIFDFLVSFTCKAHSFLGLKLLLVMFGSLSLASVCFRV